MQTALGIQGWWRCCRSRWRLGFTEQGRGPNSHSSVVRSRCEFKAYTQQTDTRQYASVSLSILITVRSKWDAPYSWLMTLQCRYTSPINVISIFLIIRSTLVYHFPFGSPQANIVIVRSWDDKFLSRMPCDTLDVWKGKLKTWKLDKETRRVEMSLTLRMTGKNSLATEIDFINGIAIDAVYPDGLVPATCGQLAVRRTPSNWFDLQRETKKEWDDDKLWWKDDK